MKKLINTSGRHRTLEGWPLVFTVLVTVSILIGGAVEFIPLVTVSDGMSNVETVKPWTPLELAGRDLYIREGCNNCHSQMVRPFRHEIERYGDYSRAGETRYERPFLWGSKRTGPDLARVGGKYPNLWHVLHFEDPRSTSPKSIMPKYNWFLTRTLKTSDLPKKMRTLQKLGVPYTEAEITNAVSIANEQATQIADDVAGSGGPTGLADKEVVAIVAYMQRLGADFRESISDANQPAGQPLQQVSDPE